MPPHVQPCAIGRCRAAGDETAFWPLRELVERLAGGLEPEPWVRSLLADDAHAGAVAERVAAALGAGESEAPDNEIAWAFRRAFEAVAAENPLVLAVDDVHWAASTLLDLIRNMTALSRRPVLVVALARPELAQDVASWFAALDEAEVIRLDPLPPLASRRLLAAAAPDLDENIRAEAIELADGVPLFLEQLAAWHRDLGGHVETDVLPPTLDAVLAARIDALGDDERTLLTVASVEGRRFHRSAVEALAPTLDPFSLDPVLSSLVGRLFLLPDEPDLPGHEAYLFVHALVRDAAYAVLSKRDRASLHADYAAWLESEAGAGTRAFDGILGSHLDAAYRLRRELGRDDDETRALGIAAGERLGAAAVRSSRLSGSVRDANALERAAELLPKGHETRAQALVESAFVLSGVGGDLDAVAAAFERAEEEAGAAGRRDLELLAHFRAAVVRLDWDGVDHASLATAITELETAGADEQVAHLHFIAFRGRPDDADARTHLAAAWRFAESSGSDGIGGQTIDSTAARPARAAAPLSDVFAWLDGLEPRTRKRPSLEAARLSALGGFLAAAGRIDEARATAAEGRVLRAELGQRRGTCWHARPIRRASSSRSQAGGRPLSASTVRSRRSSRTSPTTFAPPASRASPTASASRAGSTRRTSSPARARSRAARVGASSPAPGGSTRPRRPRARQLDAGSRGRPRATGSPSTSPR